MINFVEEQGKWFLMYIAPGTLLGDDDLSKSISNICSIRNKLGLIIGNRKLEEDTIVVQR